MSRMSKPPGPLFLGFDDVDHLIERLSKSAGDGYPPYNIERLSTPDEAARGTGANDVLRITLAVAGFTPDRIDITLEGNRLSISGHPGEDERARTYLHRGIAARQFERTFLLASGIEVIGASLKDGLLAIDLRRPQASTHSRKIAITQSE